VFWQIEINCKEGKKDLSLVTEGAELKLQLKGNIAECETAARQKNRFQSRNDGTKDTPKLNCAWHS
jgi:hypothetical protein